MDKKFEITIDTIVKIKKFIRLIANNEPTLAAKYNNILNDVKKIFVDYHYYRNQEFDLEKFDEYINNIFAFLEKNSQALHTPNGMVINKLGEIFNDLNNFIASYHERMISDPDNNNDESSYLIIKDLDQNKENLVNIIKQANDTIIELKNREASYKTSLNKVNDKLMDIQGKSDTIDANHKRSFSNYKIYNDNLKQQLDKLKKLSDEVSISLKNSDQTINRKKLAASFQTRSKLLQKQCSYWLKGIIIIISFIIYSGVTLHSTLPDISKINFDQLNIYIRGYVFHIPIALTLFWGLWFCCKQYAYSCRLRDDYHYKYDLSTAFYGYNEEVKRLAGDDKTIQLALLDIVLKNIGKNPVDSKAIETDCNSPYTEGLKKFNELVSETNKLVTNLKSSSNDEKKKEDPKS